MVGNDTEPVAVLHSAPVRIALLLSAGAPRPRHGRSAHRRVMGGC